MIAVTRGRPNARMLNVSPAEPATGIDLRDAMIALDHRPGPKFRHPMLSPAASVHAASAALVALTGPDWAYELSDGVSTCAAAPKTAMAARAGAASAAELVAGAERGKIGKLMPGARLECASTADWLGGRHCVDDPVTLRASRRRRHSTPSRLQTALCWVEGWVPAAWCCGCTAR